MCRGKIILSGLRRRRAPLAAWRVAFQFRPVFLLINHFKCYRSAYRSRKKDRDILNKLFEVYNAHAIADKNQMADKTVHFIDDRLALVEFAIG